MTGAVIAASGAEADLQSRRAFTRTPWTIRWKGQSIDLSRANLAADTRYPARALAMAAFEQRPNKYVELAARSRKRLAQIAKHADEHGALPGTLVFLRTPNGTLEVVDGLLRLAVLVAWQRKLGDRLEISSKETAWVGDIPRVERAR